MYAKTRLASEAVVDLANSENPKLYLSLLRDTSILLIAPGDIAELSAKLPSTIWSILKEDISKGRQPYRKIDPIKPDEAPITPDVVVSDQGSEMSSRPFYCHLRELPDAPPLIRCMELRRDELSVADREDFWRSCFRPSLEALKPDSPTIEYFDSYVFQDSSKARGQRNERGIKPSSKSGLIWLIDKIEKFARENHLRMHFTIYTESSKRDRHYFSQDEMLEELQRIADEVELSATSIDLYILNTQLFEDRKNRDLKQTLHSRSMILNRSQIYRFNNGLRDLNLSWSNDHKRELDSIDRSWQWNPALSDAWHQHLSDMRFQLREAQYFKLS